MNVLIKINEKITAGIFFILLLTAYSLADIKIANDPWREVFKGCWVKKVIIKREDNEFPVYFVKMHPRYVDTKILISSRYGKDTHIVDYLAEKSGAFCAINGGYFDEYQKPIGVLISKGNVIQGIPDYGLASVFCIKNNMPQIIHINDFTLTNVTEAVQCSPRLINNGQNTRNVHGLNDIARRSGICVDYSGNIIIYATNTIFDGLSFNELRKVLRIKDMNIKSALNLDGGKSTQLYFKYGNDAINIIGYDFIPVAIGFFKK